ncbi:MAG: hypothetical protein HUJ58_07895 [Erysipelotrichaceae bacterium]|nr:hypothetical protein [Erysipelotrichaceae bacterium]
MNQRYASTFAKKMHALGANCYGVKRRMTNCPEYVQHIYSFNNMDEIIPQCDIVALSLPSTPETYHIFDKRRLSLMKKDALLINVGRGNAIDTDALVEQLKNGWYTGVALDVFEREPLPEDHPLWSLDNVQITPHVSGNYNMEYTLITLVNMMIDNINRFENGQPLQNQVDRTSGYTK